MTPSSPRRRQMLRKWWGIISPFDHLQKVKPIAYLTLPKLSFITAVSPQKAVKITRAHTTPLVGETPAAHAQINGLSRTPRLVTIEL